MPGGHARLSGAQRGVVGYLAVRFSGEVSEGEGFYGFCLKGRNSQSINTTFVCTALNHNQRRRKAVCTIRERKKPTELPE